MRSCTAAMSAIALASAHLRRNLGGHPWELQGTVNLILVHEAHETALSTAPGARLQNGLDDQATTTSTGGRTSFSIRNGSPRQGSNGTSGTGSVIAWGSADGGRSARDLRLCPGTKITSTVIAFACAPQRRRAG